MDYADWMGEVDVTLAIKVFAIYLALKHEIDVYESAITSGADPDSIKNFRNEKSLRPRQPEPRKARAILIAECLKLYDTFNYPDFLADAHKILRNSQPTNDISASMREVNEQVIYLSDLLSKTFKLNVLDSITEFDHTFRDGFSQNISGIYQGFRRSTGAEAFHIQDDHTAEINWFVRYFLKIEQFNHGHALPTFTMIYRRQAGHRKITGIIVPVTDHLVFIGHEENRKYPVYFILQYHHNDYQLNKPIFGLNLVLNYVELPIAARIVFYRCDEHVTEQEVLTHEMIKNTITAPDKTLEDMDDLADDYKSILKYIDNANSGVLTIYRNSQ